MYVSDTKSCARAYPWECMRAPAPCHDTAPRRSGHKPPPPIPLTVYKVFACRYECVSTSARESMPCVKHGLL